jgi:hypothetical protein
VQEKVIERLYSINVDHDWWEFVYYDAEHVNLKISEFDLDRASYCQVSFLTSAKDTANLIIKEHGDTCETYADAQNYLKDRQALEAQDPDNEILDIDNKIEDLDEEFLRTLQEDYLIILQKEYEYRTSREAIIEHIEANEYEFTKEGSMI